MRVCFILLVFLLTKFSILSSLEKVLQLSDVPRSMEEMFAYHVEVKAFSPLLARRSCKVFLQQFDRDKLYLLQNEAETYLNLSDEKAKEIVSNYHKGTFPDFEVLNVLLQRSIARNRRLRAEVQEAIISEGDALLSEEARPSFNRYSFAKNEYELREKLRKYYLSVLQGYGDRYGLSKLSPEQISRVFKLSERKRQRIEATYYMQERSGEMVPKGMEEHYLALHLLKAMARSLDAHSAYYSPEEAYDVRMSLKKEFAGVGVILQEEVEGIYVKDLIKEGPAARSKNVFSGDKLLKINELDINELGFDEVLDRMKGRKGSVVELELHHPDHGKRKVRLQREKIVLDGERLSYSAQKVEGGIIGTVVLPSFYDNGHGVSAERDLREALKALKEQGALLGLVIDLRENSGGFLAQAIKISGMFILEGIVVISKYANGEIRYMRDLDARSYFDGPLVLLTSKASASAAEVVAQALQDYGVALVVGDERTYGKGSMQYQTITDEKASVFYKVTIGRYYTISGKSTQIEGVQADLVVPTFFSPYKIGERYLEYPLDGDHLPAQFYDPIYHVKARSYQDFVHHIAPYLQNFEKRWKKMVPALQAKSQKRRSLSQNYQKYLRAVNKKENHETLTDYPMMESVRIVQDMYELSR